MSDSPSDPEFTETWVIGDVHGCHRTLQLMLENLRRESESARFLFLGDLVGKGRDSLAVLESVHALGDCAKVILGNHDLHLLARYHDQSVARASDGLEEALADTLPWNWPDWLASRPLVSLERSDNTRNHIITHAGIHPDWSVSELVERAEHLSLAIQSADWTWYQDDSCRESFTAAVLTRMRGVHADGSLADGLTGPPASFPPEVTPWFQVTGRKTEDQSTVSGHWASLGLHRHRQHISIDAGCVYGGELIAFALGSGKTMKVPCQAEDLPDRC
ncbi:MAG: symmetrical bis(5'-nucleosyl)-tetraphosphatase [Planctomycetota bacterium]|nr:symmetrical bis(5'-nucleosyl)-tetraphosphatase [Planctomycetota bacterium]